MEAEESATKTKTKEEIESDITQTMLSLLPDFKNQADNLTLEGVRRALEKDMGMERLSLDAHKKFIKQCLEKYFYEDDANNASETEGKIAEDLVQPEKEEVFQTGDRSSDINDKLEGSPPAYGGPEQVDHETGNSHGSREPDSEINEGTIKKAIRKRAAYFRSNLEITLLEVRRLLEEDLKLEERSLDAYKKYISNELDAILRSSESVQTTNGSKKELKKSSNRKVTGKTSKGTKKVSKDSDDSDSDDVVSEEEVDEETRKPKKKELKKSSNRKVMGKTNKGTKKMSKDSDDSDSDDVVSEEEEDEKMRKPKKKELKKSSNRKVMGKTSKGTTKESKDSDDSDSDDVVSEEEEDEETRKPKKRPAQKIKADKKGLKWQKISTDGSRASGTGKKKPVEDSEKSDENDEGKSSEDCSQSSDEEEEVKKKVEKPAQVYGKQVEHLKSIIKSCGIGIPPSIYKRVKQAPESKREARLIKELEEILEKEGLSTDPSEKEIKAVKKRKERAKELEGIDMSNIVSSSRRRTTSSFLPPPKPKIESDSEDSGGKDENDEDNEEDSEEGNNDGEDSSEGSDGDEVEEESD